MWKEQELLNKENVCSRKLYADKNEGPYQSVSEFDVVEILCGMKEEKAGDPSKVTSDLTL